MVYEIWRDDSWNLSGAFATREQALAELRSALERPLGRPSRETATTLVQEVRRLRSAMAEPAIELAGSVEVPERLEPLAQSVMIEALRNALKHADPRWVRVRIERDDGAFVLEVVNDGVPAEARHRSGMGLRLAAVEALQHGGVIEFGRVEAGEWRVRLLVPAEHGG